MKFDMEKMAKTFPVCVKASVSFCNSLDEEKNGYVARDKLLYAL